ncbi:MAG: helix-turn-helix transcriptional regulator [Clostridia bacterium]|nr:helix-turn-helix transcriptional regulator [Clostridia bacterium]
MKRFLKTKRTVAVFWLISYVFLLLIPVFGNAYILMNVNHAVNQEVNLKYSYFLESMGADIDMYLREINSLSYAIRDNEAVRKIASCTEKNTQFLFDLKMTAEEVDRLKSEFKNELSVYIYLPATDMVIYNGAYSTLNEFIDYKLNSAVYNFDDYIKLLGSGTTAFRDITVDSLKKYTFLFPIVTQGANNAVLGVSIPEKSLFGKEIDMEKNDIVILSKNDDIYISSTDISEEVLNKINELNETEIGYVRINNESAGISYIKSESLNFYKYVFIDRSGTLHSASKKVVAIGIAISIVSILLMLLVLYRLYGWNYLNIKDIMNTLSDFDNDERNVENEFELIKSRIEVAKNRQSAMERDVNSRLKALKEEFIIDMLTGAVGNEEYINEGLKKYDIRFDGNLFCVSVLRVKEYGVLENTNIKNIHYIIQNIMNDILKNESYCSCEYNGLLFYIFCFKEEKDINERLYSILSESCEVTKMATEIVFTSSTSEAGEGISSLPKLYESALSVLNLSEFYGMEEHIFKKDLDAQMMDNTPVYSANVENEIIVSIKSGDKKQFFETIDTLFNDYVLVNHKWVFMGLAYSVLNSILKVIDMSGSGKTEESFDMLNSFRDYDNIEKIKDFIKKYGIHAMELFDSEKEEKSEIYEKAIKYINEHYTESDLNVARVSENIGVTAIYLAYIVKQNSGVKLSEYIAKLRVDRAKVLLDEDVEMKVEEVAKMSGFWQNRTFYNTFKKYTGLTPTQYRMLKNNNENQQ